MSDIKTRRDPPPIPDRRYDWTAIHSDTYDGAENSSTRHHIGFGRTEQEAITDLHRLDDERANWEMGEACAQGTCGCPANYCEFDAEQEIGP